MVLLVIKSALMEINWVILNLIINEKETYLI